VVGGDDGDGVAVGDTGDSTFLDALGFLSCWGGSGGWSAGRERVDVAGCDPLVATVRQGSFQPSTILRDINDRSPRAIRDAREVMRAARLLMQGNTCPNPRVQGYMVADRGGQGDIGSEEQDKGQEERREARHATHGIAPEGHSCSPKDGVTRHRRARRRESALPSGRDPTSLDPG